MRLVGSQETALEPKPDQPGTTDPWEEYAESVRLQFKLIDQLLPEAKQEVWDWGYDAVKVRRLLADQNRRTRLTPRSQRHP